MNAENLKSFGQLFDHYDVVEPGKQSRGTEMWLFLADQMLTSFGKKHFSVWKSRDQILQRIGRSVSEKSGSRRDGSEYCDSQGQT